MLKQLSSINYIKNNLNKLILNIIAIAFSMTILYFLEIIPFNFFNTLDEATVKPFEGKTILLNHKIDRSIDDESIDEIRKIKGVRDVFRVKFESIKINTVFTDLITISGFKVNKSYMDYFIKERDLKLKEGRFPSQDNEIILPEKLLRSRGLKIGDYIGNEVNTNDYLVGKYKIVGSLSDVLEGYVFSSKIVNNIEKYPNGLYIAVDEDERSNIKNSILKNHDDIEVSDYNAAIKGPREIIKTGLIIMSGIIIIVNLFLLKSINYIRIDERRGTFYLIKAMGYRTSKIFRMIVKEELLIITISIVLGSILSCTTLILYNGLNAYEMGLEVQVINIELLALNMLIPIVIFMINILDCRRYLNKNLDINAIEN